MFHLYKSGTPYTALKQINGASLHVMHLNDYPQAAEASSLNDGSRIYPGDGVAPLRQIMRDLRDSGFRGYFSLELFNRDYWTKSADENLKTAMEKSAPPCARLWRSHALRAPVAMSWRRRIRSTLNPGQSACRCSISAQLSRCNPGTSHALSLTT